MVLGVVPSVAFRKRPVDRVEGGKEEPLISISFNERSFYHSI